MHDEIIKSIDTIRHKLPETELLAQLAEESAELAQAALKLRRAIDGTNHTPVTTESAWDNLMEEVGDVLNCLDVFFTGSTMENIMVNRRQKIIRWADRLEQR